MRYRFHILSLGILLLGISCSKPRETCYDGVRNQRENKVDCGGPCKPCPSCTDGIMNQDETGIDCGGPCGICPGCNDGIQNNGETSIDCGGWCPSCTVTYPVMSTYGGNILRNDTITLINALQAPNTYYGARAYLPFGLSVRFTLQRTSGTTSCYNVNNISQNMTMDYNPGTLTMSFYSSAGGGFYCDSKLKFEGSGTMKLNIYENGSTTPQRSTILTVRDTGAVERRYLPKTP